MIAEFVAGRTYRCNRSDRPVYFSSEGSMDYILGNRLLLCEEVLTSPRSARIDGEDILLQDVRIIPADTNSDAFSEENVSVWSLALSDMEEGEATMIPTPPVEMPTDGCSTSEDSFYFTLTAKTKYASYLVDKMLPTFNLSEEHTADDIVFVPLRFQYNRDTLYMLIFSKKEGYIRHDTRSFNTFIRFLDKTILDDLSFFGNPKDYFFFNDSYLVRDNADSSTNYFKRIYHDVLCCSTGRINFFFMIEKIIYNSEKRLFVTYRTNAEDFVELSDSTLSRFSYYPVYLEDRRTFPSRHSQNSEEIEFTVKDKEISTKDKKWEELVGIFNEKHFSTIERNLLEIKKLKEQIKFYYKKNQKEKKESRNSASLLKKYLSGIKMNDQIKKIEIRDRCLVFTTDFLHLERVPDHISSDRKTPKYIPLGNYEIVYLFTSRGDGLSIFIKRLQGENPRGYGHPCAGKVPTKKQLRSKEYYENPNFNCNTCFGEGKNNLLKIIGEQRRDLIKLTTYILAWLQSEPEGPLYDVGSFYHTIPRNFIKKHGKYISVKEENEIKILFSSYEKMCREIDSPKKEENKNEK